jgi:hypothetical protein
LIRQTRDIGFRVAAFPFTEIRGARDPFSFITFGVWTRFICTYRPVEMTFAKRDWMTSTAMEAYVAGPLMFAPSSALRTMADNATGAVASPRSLSDIPFVMRRRSGGQM